MAAGALETAWIALARPMNAVAAVMDGAGQATTSSNWTQVRNSKEMMRIEELSWRGCCEEEVNERKREREREKNQNDADT